MDRRCDLFLQPVERCEVFDKLAEVVTLTHNDITAPVGPNDDRKIADDPCLLLLLFLRDSLLYVHGARVLGSLLESLLSLELGHLELYLPHLKPLLLHICLDLCNALIDPNLKQVGQLSRL